MGKDAVRPAQDGVQSRSLNSMMYIDVVGCDFIDGEEKRWVWIGRREGSRCKQEAKPAHPHHNTNTGHLITSAPWSQEQEARGGTGFSPDRFVLYRNRAKTSGYRLTATEHRESSFCKVRAGEGNSKSTLCLTRS